MKITMREIKAEVSDAFGISADDMVSCCRRQKFFRPRAMAMGLAKELTDASLPAIGREFGFRHHTTVISAIARCTELTECSPDFARKRVAISERIKLRLN